MREGGGRGIGGREEGREGGREGGKEGGRKEEGGKGRVRVIRIDGQEDERGKEGGE